MDVREEDLSENEEKAPSLLDALREREEQQTGSAASMSGRIRAHLDEIEEARRAGFTLRAIHEVMEELHGIRVSYRHFVRVCRDVLGDGKPEKGAGPPEEDTPPRGFRHMSSADAIRERMKGGS